MTKNIGIIAIKGGVGKTTVAANLAIAFAQLGRKVLAVDANFGAPNLGLHLGIVEPKYTLHDVFSNKVRIDKAVYEHELGFHFIASSLKKDFKIKPNKLKKELSRIEHHYDFVVLDSSPSLNEEMLATILASDKLLVVSSPDTTTLSTTLQAIKKAKANGTPIEGLIINKFYGKNFELKFEDIEELAGVPILAAFKHNIDFARSTCNQVPLVASNKGSSVEEYRQLAAALAGVPLKPNLATSIRRLFKTTLPEKNRQKLLE